MNNVVRSLIGILVFSILILVFMVGCGCWGTVNAGERGVKTRFNAVTGEILGEGLYFKSPLIEGVTVMDIKTQKEEVDVQAASKDLQTVTSKIALNYSVKPTMVAKLYQEVGADYKSRIIDPAVQESVKSVTSSFTAEELITHRSAVKDSITKSLADRLTGYFIVEQFSIINFDFSKTFNEAIEAKVTAEQNSLAAKNKLAQVQFEAQQAVESAKGRAEALRVESAAIAQSPQILQLRAIEKWDGKLPQVTGESTPLISLK